jgi:YD repeat-containing protein
MRVLKFIVVVFVFLHSLTLAAQPPQYQRFLPVLAPASPEAAAFARYGNYQVNLFTGIPDISVPIYEIKVGEISVPISLNYHPSGVRVTDIPSRVGLGWDLQAGGSITRKIMGKPDELPNNYLAATPISDFRVRLAGTINTSTDADLTYLNNADQGLYDLEPDVFSYSYPGHGGKFLFNQNNSFKPVLIPFSSDSIAKTWSPSNLDLSIYDASGINYKYAEKENSLSGGGITTNCTASWLMSDIISANKQDTVHFTYTVRTGTGPTDSYFSDYLVLGDNCTGTYNGAGCTTVGDFYTDNGSVSTTWKQMTQIDFKNGRIVFESAPEARQDLNSAFDLQKRLNAIKIYSYDAANKIYVLIKSINFFHSYFINGTDNATKRLKLDSIQVRTATGTVGQTYKFDYNMTVSLPGHSSKAKDFWGYYNGVTNNVDPFGNPTSIPRMQVQYNPPSPGTPFMVNIGGSLTTARDPNPSYMQAWLLQKITYPTGGNTQFEYETNQYLDDQSNPKYAGGLRIKSIKSYTDATASPVVKTYKYGPSENGYGRNNFLLEDHFFISVRNFLRAPVNAQGGCEAPLTYQKTTRTYFANPTVDIEGYDGSPVVYLYVTEYTGDGSTNAGKTIYAFSDRPDAKTTQVALGKPILTSYHFARGLPVMKQDFRRNSDGSYSLISENRRKYQFFSNQSSTGGMGLGVYKHTIYENQAGLHWVAAGGTCGEGTDSYNYQFQNYEIVSGDNKLVIDSTITYDQNNISNYTRVITNYTYDDITHLQATQTQTTNTKGEIITSAYTYPYNYGTAPYTNMTANHIYDKTIQETVTNSVSGQLSQKTSNYSPFSGNNYLPANIQLKIKSNTAETRASFNQYDIRGNILEMQKTNDAKQSLIWDYKSMQPVAEVMNAGQSDIAFTSFEGDGKGNWMYTGQTALDPTAPTGNRSFTIVNSANNITRTGLSTSTTYLVSYWKKSGTVTVNAGAGTAGRTANGWTYYEHKIVNPASGLITISGTSGIIDELRLYPAVTSQMTSYTYTPLIGVTSKCDANNRIIYYEYDGLGRLMLIRDQDKNILKKVSYNYANQPENNNVIYNAAQSSTYYKSGCSTCLTGSGVLYTVPANTYSAPTLTEANQLALNDVLANGQAYADANGTCVTPPNAGVSGSNANGISFTARFHNNCTPNPPADITFTLSANQTTVISLGSVTQGTNYSVTFSGGSKAYTYRIGSLTLYSNGGIINGVGVGSGGVIINITP